MIAVPQYLYTTGSFKRRVILKQQFTIEKGYYDPVYNTPYSEPDGLRVSIIALCSSTAQNYWTILRPYLRGFFRQKPDPRSQNFITVYPNFALWGGGLSKILQSSSHVNVNSKNHHLLGHSKTSNKSSTQLRVRSRLFSFHTILFRIFVTSDNFGKVRVRKNKVYT